MFHVFNSCNRGSRALILWCVVTFCVKTTQLLPVETNSLNFGVQAEDADIQIIKENILSQLGLDREPDISEVNISQSEMGRVLEIYRRNTRDIRAAPERKRTVRRFYTYRDEVPIQYQFRNGYFRTGRQQVLYFRLGFPGRERSRTRDLTVSSAMLSIYMVHRGSHHQVDCHRGRSNTVSVSDLPKHATVYIYQLQEPVNMENHVGYEESVHVNNSKRFYEPVRAKVPRYGQDPVQVLNPQKPVPKRLLVHAQQVLLSSDRWEIFDVSKAVESWVESLSINYWLLIECDECETHGFSFLSINSSEILASNPIRNETIVKKVSYQAPGRAFLDIELTESYSRSKRSKHKKNSRYPLDCTNGNKTPLCCRYSMMISFEELKWDWIIRPKQFEAYFCKGKCDPNYKNYVSRHARIQNLIRKIKDRRNTIPRPCCTSKKMKPLQVVYLKNENEVDTKKLRGLITSQCGCA